MFRGSLSILALLTVFAACNSTNPPATTPATTTTSTPAPAAAGDARAVPAAAVTPDGTAVAGVDAGAMKALDSMGAYMRTLTAFQISSVTTRDDVLDNGQRVKYSGEVEMLVQRPNRLRAQINSDRQQRTFLYDGQTFTLFAERMNYYGTVPAPATLGALVDTLANKYDIEMPLADLFYWGDEKHDAKRIVSAIDVGPSAVGGVSCEHYAFREADVDWQVWIQQGQFPLPRRIVITDTSVEARPEYSSEISWNLTPAFNDAAFKFDPPPGATKIVIAEVPAATAAPSGQ